MTSPAGRSTHDLLGSAAIRAATLSAWLSSPTRLREDANVEEDHARGSYRDRAVVELAQNAADAAVGTSPTPSGSGRLLLRLHASEGGALLTAANTGAPLTAEGVAALASMRASSKSAAPGEHPEGATVGRFGVGFSAVRALSDEIVISSVNGGVRFSANAVHHLLAQLAGEHAAADERVRQALLAALERPFADLPILRLPFPLADADLHEVPDLPVSVPPGYDTAVVARLRGRQETELVRRLLEEVDDALLLALPALEEIRIEVDGEAPRVLRGAAERWRTVRVEGKHRPADLADRPHEERTRTGWRLTWAVPRGGGDSSRVHEPHVLHAPTPTEEPLSFPALLVATFPLEPSRRHIAPGPATEALARHAGEAYAALVEQVARDGEDPLPLVPTGPVAGRLDAALREAATQALRRRPLLTPAEDGDGPGLLSPREAQAIIGAVGHDRSALRALSHLVPHLVVLPPGHDAQLRLRALGLQMRELGDVVDGLPLTLDPPRWREVYDALDPHVGEPGVADALSGLPVPLVDGGLVRGPRGLVLPSGGEDPRPQAVAALAPWGLRIVDPSASHPLLRRLGATEGSPRGLLHHPALPAAVAALASDAGGAGADHLDAASGHGGVQRPVEPAAVRDAILEVVGAAVDAGADPAEVVAAYPWLGTLPLPTDDGEPAPARELTLPGSWAERVLDALPPLDAAVVGRYGAATLRAVGVREGLAVVRLADVVAEEAPGLGSAGDAPEDLLDRWPEYLLDLAEVLGAGAYVGEVSAVADLDAVGDDAWPEVLARLAADPEARAALVSPVRGRGGREAPSYTSWWLRGFLDAPFAAPGAGVPFVPPAPPEVRAAEASGPLGDDVLAALGAVHDLSDLDAAGWERLLDHLPEVGHEVPMRDAVAVWRGLAALLAEVPADTARLGPDRLPVLSRTDGQGRPTAVIAAAEDVAVAPEPMWGQVARAVVPAPAFVAEALADALDVLLLGDGAPPTVSADAAVEAPTPAAVLALLPAAPLRYLECEELRVDGTPVEWWVSDDQVWATTTAGLARGLAQSAGQWEARALVESVLTDPGRAADLLLERGWDEP